MLGHIVHALLESFYALNVMQLTDLRKQWLYLWSSFYDCAPMTFIVRM